MGVFQGGQRIGCCQTRGSFTSRPDESGQAGHTEGSVLDFLTQSIPLITVIKTELATQLLS